MRVYLETDELKSLLTFDVNPEVTVEDFLKSVNAGKNKQIRRILYSQNEQNVDYHLSGTIWRLSFKGVEMKKDKTLRHYSIHEGAILKVVDILHHLGSPGYFLYVIMPSGDDVKLAVSVKSKISEVKSMIKDERGLSIASQRLLVRDEEMEDSKTLLDYGIKTEAVILLETTGNSYVHLTKEKCFIL